MHHQVDRAVGAALALLALAVMQSARGFPTVPGQRVGAAFLPMLIGAGLLLCGLGLMWRSRKPLKTQAETPERPRELLWPAAVVMAVCVGYIFTADVLGFLIVAPLMLLLLFKTLGVRWLPALTWALVGALLVHLVFYKLLRVPLPWGLLPPLY